MKAVRVWREGDAPTEHTHALDAVMAANEKLIGDAAVHAYRNNLAVLVMPRVPFERAAWVTGREVAAELDNLHVPTVVGPLPTASCAAMVLWAGLPDPTAPIIEALLHQHAVPEATVIIVAVVELPTGPRTVVSVVAVDLEPAGPAVDVVPTQTPRGDA